MPIKAIAEHDEGRPTTAEADVDDAGTLRLDAGDGLFDYSPLKLQSFKRGLNTLGGAPGTPRSGPAGSSNAGSSYAEPDERDMETIEEMSPRSRAGKKSRSFLNAHATYNKKNIQTILRRNNRTVKSNQQQQKEIKRAKGYNASLETGERYDAPKPARQVSPRFGYHTMQPTRGSPTHGGVRVTPQGTLSTLRSTLPSQNQMQPGLGGLEEVLAKEMLGFLSQSGTINQLKSRRRSTPRGHNLAFSPVGREPGSPLLPATSAFEGEALSISQGLHSAINVQTINGMISKYHHEKASRKQAYNRDISFKDPAPSGRIEDIRIIPLSQVNALDSAGTSRADDSDIGSGGNLEGAPASLGTTFMHTARTGAGQQQPDGQGEFRPFSVHLLDRAGPATGARVRDSLKRESYDMSREDTEMGTVRADSHLDAGALRSQPIAPPNAAYGAARTQHAASQRQQYVNVQQS